MRLRPRKLDQAILAAIEARDLHEFAGRPMRLLADALGGAEVLVHRFGPSGPAPIGGTLAPIFEEYMQHYAATDAMLPRIATRPRDSFVVTMGELGLDEVDYYRSAVFNDFYQAHGIGELLGVFPDGIPFGRPGAVGLLLGRDTRAPFDDRAHRMLLRARPFFRATLERCQRVIEPVADAAPHAAHGPVEPHLRWTLDGKLAGMSEEGSQLLPHGRIPPEFTAAARAFTADVLGGRVPSRPTVSAAVSDTTELALTLALDGRGQDDAPQVTGWLSPRFGKQSADLSRCERTVLAQLALGISNAEIAARLFVSEATVRTHVQRILDKLGLSSRAQAGIVAHTLFFPAAPAATSRLSD